MKLTMSLVMLAMFATTAAAQERKVGSTPWGPQDEIGRLNLMTAASGSAVLFRVAGVENIPPTIARGVMIDVAAAKGVNLLPDGYRISRDDLEHALARQQVSLREGDVVLIRTGRMQRYEDAAAYMNNPPGLGFRAAQYLVEEGGAMIIGADNLSLEAFPSELESDYVPVHTYLLAEQGAPILELVYLEDLSRDRLYEFAFIGGSLKFRGADAAPIRPIALPLRQ